ncbi:hypothetical protein [Psychromonas ossibalaenae]|uniref:hypothetical protein n=1 Tax=Psychromonas ossibalaenae TaxID=444922 RepID=UPI00037E4781|nr:hypothetical protein [Psychromonas ossibalaenae]
MLKLIIAIVALTSSSCFAVNVPSNLLQVQYQKSVKQQAEADEFNFSSVSQIPEVTYNYLNEIFTSFSQTLSLSTPITNSTFENNSYYELISVPLIAPNNDNIQLEFFSNFSNPSTAYLSNMSDDHAMSDYMSNTQHSDFYDKDTDIGFGAGFSFNTSPTGKIKIIISNEEIPGYGNSKALIGFESKF